MVLLVLLHGMRDQDIHARTFIQIGKLTKLSEVVEYIGAEETGIMQSKDICHETIDVSGVRKSTYKKGEVQPKPPLQRCGYCGLAPRGKRELLQGLEQQIFYLSETSPSTNGL